MDKPDEGTVSVSYYGIEKSLDLQGLEKQPLDVNIIFTKVDTSIGQGQMSVEGQLTDILGRGIVGVPLTLKVEGFNTTVNTVEEGKFSWGLMDLTPGTYCLTVIFEGNDDYKESSNDTSFIIENESVDPTPSPTPSGDVTPPATKKISTVITAAHTKIFTYNKAIDSKAKLYFIVTLKDANGKVLANKAFKYIVNGKTYNYKTNAKGQKKIYILSKAKKTISAKISFAGEWVQVGSEWKYIENGHYETNKILDLSDGLYYINEFGSMATNRWIEFSSETKIKNTLQKPIKKVRQLSKLKT